MSTIRQLIKNLPLIRQLVVERNKLHLALAALKSEVSALKNELSGFSSSKEHQLFVPPGHFYSPIPSLDYITQHCSDIFKTVQKQILGIDLREEEQLQLLKSLKPYYDEIPFQSEKSEHLRPDIFLKIPHTPIPMRYFCTA